MHAVVARRKRQCALAIDARFSIQPVQVDLFVQSARDERITIGQPCDRGIGAERGTARAVVGCKAMGQCCAPQKPTVGVEARNYERLPSRVQKRFFPTRHHECATASRDDPQIPTPGTALGIDRATDDRRA